MAKRTKYQPSPVRQRMLSNENTKYIGETKGQIIHEKHCEKLRNLSDTDVVPMILYNRQWKQCRDCALRAYLRYGAKEPADEKKYLAFFKETGLSSELAERLYIDNKAKTSLQGRVLTVECNKDIWQIELLDASGNVKLLHNNYEEDKNGLRSFTGGFHVQNDFCHKANIDYVLNVIFGYTYKSHRLSRIEDKQKEFQKEQQNGLPEEKPDRKRKGWKQLLLRLFRKKKVEVDGSGTMSFLAEGFIPAEKRRPHHNELCLFVWKEKEGRLHFQTGYFDAKQRHFVLNGSVKQLYYSYWRVVAWQRLNEVRIRKEKQE